MLIQKGQFTKKTMILLAVLAIVMIAGGIMVYNSFFAGPPAPDAAIFETNTAEPAKPLTYTIDDTIFENPQFYSLSKEPFPGYANQYVGIALDPNAPIPPKEVTVTNQKVGRTLLVQWRIPEYVNFNLVRVYRMAAGATEGIAVHEQSVLEVSAGSRMAYQDTDLVDGTRYYYLVRTVYTEDGDERESSNTIPVAATPTDEIAPDQPLNVTIDSSSGEGIMISWTPPIDSDFAFVRIYRSATKGKVGELIYPKELKDWEDGATSYFDSVASNIPYYYTVSSVDLSGNESSKDILAIPVRQNPFEPIF